MLIAADNKEWEPCGYYHDLGDLFYRWPRGAERRHFRGKKCVNAIDWLRAYEPKKPENLIDALIGVIQPILLPEVMERVQKWELFGPWIAFKAADMIERVLGVTVLFPSDLTLIYKEPRAALDLLDVAPEDANIRLLNHFRKFPAPPLNDRVCNIQECETVLCKWKSSVGGHYHIGKDIHEVRNGLKGWGTTAQRLYDAMPPEVEGGLFK
jgi:hypothetical protein